MMRFIHTSDWHLGQSLRGHDRDDDLFGAVARVLNAARDEGADALLVCGDVFEARTTASRKHVAARTRRLVDLLRPHLQGGLEVILIPGNHDDRDHFEMMHALLGLGTPEARRLHVATKRSIVEVKGVAFGIVPYPDRARLSADAVQELAGSVAENVSLGARYAQVLRTLGEELDATGRPCVLALHVAVSGLSTTGGHDLTSADEITLGRADLPDTARLAYVALGHIHRDPGDLGHVVPCRYSGSIERLDHGERGDEKHVLLVEVPDAGPANVRELPLPVTPFYDFEGSAAEVEAAAADCSDLVCAFSRFTIKLEHGDDAAAITRRLRARCPRAARPPPPRARQRHGGGRAA